MTDRMFKGFYAPDPCKGYEEQSFANAWRAFNSGDNAWCYTIACQGRYCGPECIYTCRNDESIDARYAKLNAFADWLAFHGYYSRRPGYERKRSPNITIGKKVKVLSE